MAVQIFMQNVKNNGIMVGNGACFQNVTMDGNGIHASGFSGSVFGNKPMNEFTYDELLNIDRLPDILEVCAELMNIDVTVGGGMFCVRLKGKERAEQKKELKKAWGSEGKNKVLSIEAVQEGSSSGNVKLEVMVPEQFDRGQLRIKTVSGNVTLRLMGESRTYSADLSTCSGNIDIHGDSWLSEIDASTSSGNIIANMSMHNSIGLKMDTRTGNIGVECRNVDTMFGSATSKVGSVRIGPSDDKGKNGVQYKLRTSTGNIRLN